VQTAPWARGTSAIRPICGQNVRAVCSESGARCFWAWACACMPAVGLQYHAARLFVRLEAAWHCLRGPVALVEHSMLDGSGVQKLAVDPTVPDPVLMALQASAPTRRRSLDRSSIRTTSPRSKRGSHWQWISSCGRTAWCVGHNEMLLLIAIRAVHLGGSSIDLPDFHLRTVRCADRSHADRRGHAAYERSGARRSAPADESVVHVSYTEESLRQHGVLAPDVAFMQKPITPDAMLRKIREVLERPQSHARSVRHRKTAAQSGVARAHRS
jgi:hypothetical protein